MSDSTKQSERIAIAMNDDRQAGRKEIGVGGEWTALRELKAKWLELADSAECYAEEAKRHSYPPEKIESHARTARTLKKCAADLEALAAAAPAPGAAKHALNVYNDLQCKYCGLSVGRWPSEPECVAPPPQDGQGAELLGPPRGGSSSDLAEHSLDEAVTWLQSQIDWHDNQESMADAMDYVEFAKYHNRQRKALTTARDLLRAANVMNMIEGQARLDGAVAGNASAPVGGELEKARQYERSHAYPFSEGDEPPMAKCPKCGEVAEQDSNGRDFCRECDAPVGEKSEKADVTKEEFAGIKQGLADVAAGRVKPLEQIKAELAGQPSGVQQSSDSVTARAYEVFGLTMREKLGKREPSMNAWAEQARLVDETYRELMKSLPAG